MTSVLFHPCAFAAGVRFENVMTGAVASRLIVTDCEEVPPELVAVHVNVVPAVSVVTLLVPHPLWRGDRRVGIGDAPS